MIIFSGDGPTVWYGSEKKRLDFKATATTKTYKREDMCGFPANSILAFRDPGLIHDALLINLEPGIQYFYRFGSEKVTGMFLMYLIERYNVIFS